ncbi:MAG: dephospho-CoA kinase [Hamadaea sp.]|nr:dephospho-CoA kinase [Hamadaea sp.]NUT03603.1 dephospho-CoA kinase [Hamadaea sp.]
MLFVGLTGGIGSGKSSVAARLRELGAVVIDSDRLAREVVEPGTDGHAEVVARFGTGVLAPDGSIDRAALAAKIFGDADARKALEGIIHPRVRARTAELAMAASPDAVVVNDVPLLVEAGLADKYQLVIVVLASEEIRVARLVAARGMTEAEAHARIAAQATDEQRRAVADVLIVNEGTLDDLRAQVDQAWPDLAVAAASNA